MLTLDEVRADIDRWLEHHAKMQPESELGVIIETVNGTINISGANVSPTSSALVMSSLSQVTMKQSSAQIPLAAVGHESTRLYLWQLDLPSASARFSGAVAWCVTPSVARHGDFPPLFFREFAEWTRAHLIPCFANVSPYYMISHAFQARAPKLAVLLFLKMIRGRSAILWTYDPNTHSFQTELVVGAAPGDYVLSVGRGIIGQLSPLNPSITFSADSSEGIRPFHPELWEAENWHRCQGFAICSRGALLGAVGFYWRIGDDAPFVDNLKGSSFADLAAGYLVGEVAEAASAAQIQQLEGHLIRLLPAQALMTFMHDIQKSLKDAMTAMTSAAVVLSNSGNIGNQKLGQILSRSANFIDTCMNRTGRLALLRQRRATRRRVDLQRLLLDLKPLLEMYNSVHVSVRVPAAAVHIVGDRLGIERVFLNLVENAIYWTEAKLSGERKVDVKLTVNEKTVSVRIEDSGVGVGPEVRDRIFEKFVTGRPETGSGLGLYLARETVEGHGGTIDFFANQAGGTTFNVQFPRLAR